MAEPRSLEPSLCSSILGGQSRQNIVLLKLLCISIDWSSPNGPIKCQFQICRIQTIMTGDQCMQHSHAFEVYCYLSTCNYILKIGPHCVMSDDLLRSSPCYRPNTITLMALALIRQSLLITLLLDKVSNDDNAWHVTTW